MTFGASMDIESESKQEELPSQSGKLYGCSDTKLGCFCCFVWTSLVSIAVLMALAVGTLYLWTWPATDFTNVEFTGPDGTTLHAYLATPSAGAAPNQASAAIIFHAWNGMSEEATYFADRLAEQGYYALAPDLFRNVASAAWNVPRNVFNVIGADQDRMNHDTDAALAYLLSLGQVNESRIVSGPGFCFGGTQSLVLASRRPVLAAVTLYGTIIRDLGDAESEVWGLLGQKSPVLGIYGALDEAPSPEEATGFAAALQARGVEHNVTIYPDVGHAFVTPETHRDEEHPLHATTLAAWTQVVHFLANVNATLESGDRVYQESIMNSNVAHHKHASHSADTKNMLFHHRVLCALKCFFGMLTGTGHVHHSGLPAFGLNWMLAAPEIHNM